MKIILDAMGGDNAPEAVVLGALDAAKDFNTEIILVGRGEDILAAMEKNGIRATVRRKLGADINASCGQLRRAAMKEGGA